MKYIEFKVHASRQGIEQVTAVLMSAGIDQVSIDDPDDIEDILNRKNEYGWDYIDDELKEDLEREPSVSAYLEDTEENRRKGAGAEDRGNDAEKQGTRGPLRPGRRFRETVRRGYICG